MLAHSSTATVASASYHSYYAQSIMSEQEQSPLGPNIVVSIDSQSNPSSFGPAVPLACLLTGGYWWWFYHTEWSHSAVLVSTIYFLIATSLLAALTLVALARTPWDRGAWQEDGDTSRGVELGVTAMLIVPIVALQLGVCFLGLVLSLQMMELVRVRSLPPRACPATAGCDWLVLAFFVSVVLLWTRLHPAPAWMEKKAYRGRFVYETVSLFLFKRKDFS